MASISRPPGPNSAAGHTPETVTLVSRALELLETLPESDDRALVELTARMLRGPNLSSMHGYFSPDVEADYRRAQALAARLGRPEVLPALIAIWAYWLSRARLSEAEAVLDQLTAMVGEAGLRLVRAGGAGVRRATRTSSGAISSRPRSGWSGRWPA